MTDSKMFGWQSAAARKYYLLHPDASINDVAVALAINHRTVSRVRKILVAEGMLEPGRGRKPSLDLIEKAESAPSAPVTESAKEPIKVDTTGLLDHKAMKKLATIENTIDDDVDDEETRKRMIREVRRIAFDTEKHPDTRMSATQLWVKLKDMAKDHTLGPGKPLTYADALARATDFLRAIGAKMAIEAMYAAFEVEAPSGEAKTVESSSSSPPPIESPSPTVNIALAGYSQNNGGVGGVRSELSPSVDQDQSGREQSADNPVRDS